jgi:hypothetical protein
MKKSIFLILIIFANCFSDLSAQAKKPTLMVVPSDNWCLANGYMMEFNDQGSTVRIPDYKRAFQEDSELMLMISKINGLMAERDFPLKNMETVIKNLNSYAAEDAMRSSKSSGAEVAESPIDQLKSVAKADIIMQLGWTVNKTGPKRSVTFNLQGLDAYSSKQIATATGTGGSSFSTETNILLEEAVISHLDNFSSSLQNHFDDMFENGREVFIRIKKWDNWEHDLETEFEGSGDELGFLIEDWFADHSVSGRFSVLDATENMLVLEQVRIPMFYERNGHQRAMDTRRFIKELSEYLEAAPFNIENKITTRGLGEATLFLGSK